jgi:hypothetical protein
MGVAGSRSSVGESKAPHSAAREMAADQIVGCRSNADLQFRLQVMQRANLTGSKLSRSKSSPNLGKRYVPARVGETTSTQPFHAGEVAYH